MKPRDPMPTRLAVTLGLLFAPTVRAATLELSMLSEGDLVLSEVHIDPVAVDDSRGEWIEIYNATADEVDLKGLVLSDNDVDSTTIADTVLVAAGDYALLAVNGKSTLNGGLPAVDYVITRSQFRLDNGADEVFLSYGDVVFDSLSWTKTGDFVSSAGVSLALDPAHLDASLNDLSAYWCDGSTAYGLGDLGTPGSDNDDCGLITMGPADLAAGDLIITEVMVDPGSSIDALGEWFEIYNNSGADLNLSGLVLRDGGTDAHTITGDLMVYVGEYVLLAAKSDPAVNGGLPTVDYAYTRSEFRFDNNDEIYLWNGTENIDGLVWTKADFGVVEGASLSLDPGSLDATANDDAAGWCAGFSSYGDGDLGTPAAANDACPTDDDADGYASDVDCDDTDPAINPGADELCNSVDDNCDGDIDGSDAVDASQWSLDYDRDGYGGGILSVTACDNPLPAWYVDNTDDCNDLSADDFPGADETCDGDDNDCDGDTDEDGAVDAPAWYADADSDGYGDAASSMVACEPASGFVGDDQDCDDGDAAVFPGADEYCNSADDNCDGDIDEDSAVDAAEWYLDYDDDGYGADKITAFACSAPTYFVSNVDDCDDLRADISPAAAEVCNDGIDNNCDDSALDCSVTGDVDLADVDAKLIGNTTYTDVGRAVAGLGDTNGDGFPDLAFGAAGTTLLGTGSGLGGAVYVVAGPVTGTAALEDIALATLTGEAEDDQAGYAVGAAGDPDGDGYSDLLIGARDEDSGGTDGGAVYLVSGPVTGTMSLASATAKLSATGDYNVAGFVVSGLGDLDGDGVRDVVTGAYGNSDAASEAGAVYIVSGPVTGAASLGDADAILLGEADSDRAGRWVSSDRDVNGDGVTDLLVGAYLSDAAAVDGGRAYLSFGPFSGTSSLADADVLFDAEAAGDEVGYTVDNGGDVDGDGYGDVLITAVYEHSVATRNGAVYLIYGPASTSMTLSSADAKLVGAATGDHAGVKASLVQDLNGDERDDVVVGAFGVDTGGSNAGAAYLAYGPVVGTMSVVDSDAVFIGEDGGDRVGIGVGSAFDVNQDGYNDLLVGALEEATGGTNAGAAYLILGQGW